ncbi:MAG: hypothetical protein KJ787_12780 [Gammaproteobacteria bacterium]|nr:hypothetical protein [Gammaproteobacteria bacterium]MBU1647198.1 hypothetical protein [Gammaproteobacteria bacterium]MBU1972710.1 hypothetical protein [Gammaproteobacteria bacterium]
MNLRHLACLLLLAPTAFAARAEVVACPDLATAVQVATCPSEEELKYTFTGYCSDNSRAYRGDTDVCTDYRSYRKLKNVAMWESADGMFQAYVSCDLPPEKVRQAKAVAIKSGKQGKITRLACSYGEGLTFTYRTRAECKVQGAGNCAADAGACKAGCD